MMTNAIGINDCYFISNSFWVFKFYVFYSFVRSNSFIGTDTTIIPPLLVPEDGSLPADISSIRNFGITFSFSFAGIWSYDASLCRSMGITYANVQTNYNDIPVYVYDFDLSSEQNAKKCFCRDENTCPPNGTFDMFRCSGVRMNQICHLRLNNNSAQSPRI